MKHSPLVSILVPVYNAELYLDETLASVAAQTLGDLEVVISDDCSTDRSREIAARWAGKDERFRLLTNQANLGMTGNWNRALGEARGAYVLKLDADDVIRPRCLELLAAELEGDEEVYVAYCRTLSCDERLEPLGSYRGDSAFLLNGMDPLCRQVRPGHEYYRMCFADIQLWCSNAQMHRRQNLLALGGWDATYGCASDTDLILRTLEQNRKVSHNPYPGVLYRHLPGSVSDSFRKKGWIRWESVLVHLNSLERYRRGGGKLDPILRRAWWRFWYNLNLLKKDGTADLSNIPEPIRSRLAGAAEGVARPTARVLLEGQTRQWAWGAKITLRRALRLAERRESF